MENDRVRGCKFPGVAHPIYQEVHFAQCLIAAVEPGVEPPLAVTGKRTRDHQAIRLDALVDFGHVAANHQTRRRCPWRPALLQFIRTLLPFPYEFLCSCDLFRLEELTVFQSEPDCIAEDLYVREEPDTLQLVDAGAKAG